ncbi:MAG: CAP domain-containing protein, partial [Blastochloris sp.]|nr:CAP domain-containing protein [Blastochloris sp.]
MRRTSRTEATTFDYHLEIVRTNPCADPTKDPYESNNTIEQAKDFPLGGSQTHAACYPFVVVTNQGDRDWSRITIDDTAIFTLDIISDSTVQSVRIFGDDGTTIIAESAKARNHHLEQRLAAGTYYVEVFLSPLFDVADNIPPYTYTLSIVTAPYGLPPTTPKPDDPNVPLPEIISLEEALFQRINGERFAIGLPPLARNDSLLAAARLHSQDMASTGTTSHTGSDGSTNFDRVSREGYKNVTALGENIAYISDPEGDVVDAWMGSTAFHRPNILSPYFREVGISGADGYYTAVFASSFKAYPITINQDAEISASSVVTISLLIDDLDGRAWQYMLSDSPTFIGGQWESLDVETAVARDEVTQTDYTFVRPVTDTWTLPAGEGLRTVYVKYRDHLGNEYVRSDTIWLVPPPITSTAQPIVPPLRRYTQNLNQLGAVGFDLTLEAPGGLMRPQLNLHADSFLMDEGRAYQGSSVGAGATLGEYAIVRRPDSTPSDTNDDSYLLIWDGVLWPLIYADPATGGDGLYHRMREQAGEELFIARHTGAGHGIDAGTYWEIRNRDGITWRLGFTTDSTWRFAAGSTSHAWRWNLDRVSDIHGNYQVWSYTKTSATLSGIPYDRSGQLATIAWNGHTTQNPDRQLRFVYEARTPTGQEDYLAADRFYRTERLREILVEINGAPVTRYRLGYEVRNDGARWRVLLNTIEQRDANGATILNQFGLEYDSLGQSGEGFHLAQVSQHGTLRSSYTYESFAVNGLTRYRVETTNWVTSGTAPVAAFGQRLVSVAAQSSSNLVGIRATYGSARTNPDGSWSHDSVREEDSEGNAQERRYRSEPGLQGEEYKNFCETADSGTQTVGSHGSRLFALNPNGPGAAICHEQVANYSVLPGFSGSIVIQTPSIYEDVRRVDGTYQQLQTNTTRNATGQPIYIDQYGEQAIQEDDRFIERD